jgi:type IV pilus assembly protein PilZ
MTAPTRRLHERWELRLPVLLEHRGEDGLSPLQQTPGTTRNFSLGGMLIDVSAPIPFGAPVTVRVVLPPLKEESSVEATVRWVRDGVVGAQFGSLRAKDVWALNQLFKSAPAAD